MAKISICVESFRKNRDGSYPIRIKITNRNTKAYIATRFKISDLSQWDGNKVVNMDSAESINSTLGKSVGRYSVLAASIPHRDMTAKEIKDYINGAKDFIEKSTTYKESIRTAIRELRNDIENANRRIDALCQYLDLITVE